MPTSNDFDFDGNKQTLIIYDVVFEILTNSSTMAQFFMFTRYYINQGPCLVLRTVGADFWFFLKNTLFLLKMKKSGWISLEICGC